MLEMIQKLLIVNQIGFKLINNTKTFNENMSEFKTNPNISVLLMPYFYGANGLNTHVLLVEPTPKRAQELQAIGRVHRIVSSSFS